jgi:hypothetical protein
MKEKEDIPGTNAYIDYDRLARDGTKVMRFIETELEIQHYEQSIKLLEYLLHEVRKRQEEDLNQQKNQNPDKNGNMDYFG